MVRLRCVYLVAYGQAFSVGKIIAFDVEYIYGFVMLGVCTASR